MAYSFSKEYGHDNYVLYNNFDTQKKDANKNITSVISDFQHQIASRSSDPVISRYLKNYRYVPLWVLNNILTFGQISKFYSILKQRDKQQVSRIFHIQDKQLESILYYLSSIRNFCVHGNRLYCYRAKRPLVNFDAHTLLKIPLREGKEFDYGKRDFFACMIALKYVLPKSDFLELIDEIYQACSALKKNLNVINETEILEEMRFPSNWYGALRSLVNSQ